VHDDDGKKRLEHIPPARIMRPVEERHHDAPDRFGIDVSNDAGISLSFSTMVYSVSYPATDITTTANSSISVGAIDE
jgi:hypothetical protein